ncbi:MAG: TIR domain-containing protein [Cytophagaceae bacterium]
MRELEFHLKKFQEFTYRGEWKDGYSHLYERVYDILDKSQFGRRSFYLKELENYNKIMYNLPHRLDDEEKLEFRKNQKHIIDLLYLINEENKKIFISYGKDTTMKDKVCTLLGKLKLDFNVLDEESKPYTIDTFIKNARECSYGIFLFSADDNVVGSDKQRTSQNVAFELGYFTGHTLQKNLIAFHPHDKFIEIPIQFGELHYQPFILGGQWKKDLINHMKKSGMFVDPELSEKILNK